MFDIVHLSWIMNACIPRFRCNYIISHSCRKWPPHKNKIPEPKKNTTFIALFALFDMSEVTQWLKNIGTWHFCHHGRDYERNTMIIYIKHIQPMFGSLWNVHMYFFNGMEWTRKDGLLTGLETSLQPYSF